MPIDVSGLGSTRKAPRSGGAAGRPFNKTRFIRQFDLSRTKPAQINIRLERLVTGRLISMNDGLKVLTDLDSKIMPLADPGTSPPEIKLETAQKALFYTRGEIRALEEEGYIKKLKTDCGSTNDTIKTLARLTLKAMGERLPIQQDGTQEMSVEKTYVGTETGLIFAQTTQAVGRGAQGQAWLGKVMKGEDEDLDLYPESVIVVKVMPCTDKNAAKSARREAIKLCEIKHPNVVKGYDYVIHQNEVVLFEEYVRGKALHNWIQAAGGHVAPKVAREIIKQVALGLQAVNDEGIIHRDVNPKNIIIKSEKKSLFAKLIDFGILKDLESKTQATESNFFKGTPGYISPEEIRDEALGPQSDMYSLGCTLWRTLTGRKPFSFKKAMREFNAKLEKEIKQLKTQEEKIKKEMEEIKEEGAKSDKTTELIELQGKIEEKKKEIVKNEDWAIVLYSSGKLDVPFPKKPKEMPKELYQLCRRLCEFDAKDRPATWNEVIAALSEGGEPSYVRTLEDSVSDLRKRSLISEDLIAVDEAERLADLDPRTAYQPTPQGLAKAQADLKLANEIIKILEKKPEGEEQDLVLIQWTVRTIEDWIRIYEQGGKVEDGNILEIKEKMAEAEQMLPVLDVERQGILLEKIKRTGTWINELIQALEFIGITRGKEGPINLIEKGIFGVTHKGTDPVNQDGIAVVGKDLFLVGDGMGGHKSGHLASDEAIKIVVKEIKLGKSLEDAFEIAHQRIQTYSDNRATCLAAVQISKNSAKIVSAGDVRPYLIKADGRIILLSLGQNAASLKISQTHDLVAPLSGNDLKKFHNEFVNYPEEEKLKNRVYGGIGRPKDQDRVKPERLEILLEEGDQILVTTDGWHGFVSYDIFQETIKSTKNTAERIAYLKEAALNAMSDLGKGDNLSLMIYEHLTVTDPIDIIDARMLKSDPWGMLRVIENILDGQIIIPNPKRAQALSQTLQIVYDLLAEKESIRELEETIKMAAMPLASEIEDLLEEAGESHD